MGEKRSYQHLMAREGLVGFHVRHKETELFIQAERDLSEEASRWVLEARIAIEEYARSHSDFIKSLTPVAADVLAPPIVRTMMEAAAAAGVGPMASVAGTIAAYIGEKCREASSGEVLVENGGDLFIWSHSPVTSAIWAGSSPLSGRVGITVGTETMPVGVCTSSGTVGHSRSFGVADSVTVISGSASLADAAATAVGNLIRSPADITAGLDAMAGIKEILGGVIIVGAKMGAWGRIQLVRL